ncbi:TrmH family RNA methyltransferase [Kordia algicida OT-1]|uniref:RNA methylase, SpoU family protein n=1 Tax=Kordia algicida OT-1 TaxID=391587 RepID=A9DUK2_9FLAO|nr:TrmH family RNA methyltransferase [Kordia algicida]EDP96301.1 RNA methylase, SpoU family protein [Kordia algicida OT-1]
MSQLTHYTTNFEKRIFPITLVSDQVSNAPNIGSLFRICDAFGVEKIIFCGDNIPVFGRRMTKTSRATEKVVPFEITTDIHAVVSKLKDHGYTIISLEITENSQSIHTIDFSKYEKIALVIGDENFGVNPETIYESDVVMHIDMFGQNSSMNVVQATNIVLYEITRQHLVAK